MVVIGLYNVKGGVGKSTTAVNLSLLAALEGRKTLLWDLDPQGACGYYLGRSGKSGSGKKLLRGGTNPKDFIERTDFENLDILPSRLWYRNLDLRLDASDRPRKLLARIVASLGKGYDWVFLDCPPGITLLSENIFRAVDRLLVPLIPSPLSIRAFEEVSVFFKRHDLDRSILLPFFSMADPRKRIHRETMELLSAREKSICRSFIPFLSSIERMSATRRPVVHLNPRSPAASAYRALWDEVRQRLA